MHPGDRTYRNELVRITDLVVTDDFIQNVTFENCQIVGPAVLVMQGCELVGTSLEGDFESSIWPISSDRTRVIGAIGLVNCRVFGSRLTRIGLAVPEHDLDSVRTGFGF